MAAAAESFSIREYAARMRSLDFGKCWPFAAGGGGEGEGEGESLPPMPIRKFRWWSDELAAAMPAAAPQTLEEEGRLSRAGGRAKQRTPKKRSIVELFAVAPQIEAVEEEADGCDGEDGSGVRDDEEKLDEERGGGAEERSGNGLAAGDGGGCFSGDMDKARKRKERVKGDENGGKTRKKSSVASTKKKKSKKKQRLQIKIRVAKKVKTCKSRVKSSLSISQLLQEVVCKRMFRKSLKVSALNKRKKPPSVKVVLEKPNPNPKLFRNKHKVARKDFPVHSILKKQINTSSTTKTCSTNGVEAHYPQKSSCELRKHVTFSGKDYILGYEDGTPGTPNTQNLCHTSSDISTESGTRHVRNEGDKPADTDKSLLVNERGADVAPAPTEMTDICRPAASLDATVHSNVNIPDKGNPFLSEFVGLNHDAENSNLNCLNSDHSALSSSQSCLGNRVARSGVNEQSCHMTLDVTRGLLVPVSSSSKTCSQAMTKNLVPQPSTTSCLVTNFDLNEKKDSLIEGKRNSNCHLLEVQPRPHLSHKEVLSSISSSTGSNKSTDTRLTTDYMSSCRNFCLGEDYIGRPCNSQGELIKMHSGATFSPNELFKQQDMVKCSSGSFPVHGHIGPSSSMACANIRGNPAASFYWNDNLGWYQERYPPIMPITSGFGFVQLPGFERMEIYEPIRRRDPSLHHGQYLMSLSHSGCRQHGHQAQNTLHKEKFHTGHSFNKEAKPATEPTMRLMGQTVKVGNTSKECACSDNGKIWSDKGIIAESSRSVMKSSASPYRSPQVGVVAHGTTGPSKGDRMQPLGGVQSSLYNIPAVEMRLDSMHFGHQPHYGPHPRVMLNKTSMPNMNTITRYSEVEHQMPFLAGQHQNISPHMLLNSTHCKHSQSTCFSSSTSNPHNYGSFVELTPAQPSTCLPRLLLHAKQKTQKSSFQTYHDPTSVHHPCFMSGIRLPSVPSTHPRPALSFPVSNSSKIQPCGSTPVHPSFAPPYPRTNPTAVGASVKDKDNKRNELKSKFAMLKSIDWAKKNKKRHAEKNDGLPRPLKKPHLAIENDLNVPTVPSEEDLSGCKSFGGAPEMPAGSTLVEMGAQHASNEKNDSSGITSSVGGRKSGPIKLSAGAKHVLKPSPTLDQDNSRPSHSTVPLAVGTSSNMDFSQKKTAEIYRF